MSEKTLSVRLHGRPVGELTQGKNGKMAFRYLDSASQSLSLSLPLQAEPFDETHTEAYFGGLLPESEAARRAIAQRYGIHANNTFALLKAIGYDCAGAVSLHDLKDPIQPQEGVILDGELLSESGLAKHIQALPPKAFILGS